MQAPIEELDELIERHALNAEMGAVSESLGREEPAMRRKRVYDLQRLRPATKNLIAAILLDTYPNVAALTDFGIRTQEHYEAIYYPVRECQITPEQLEAVLGNGPKITALVRAAEANPHKEIEFTTPYDDLFKRLEKDHPLDKGALAAESKKSLADLRAGGEEKKQGQENARGKGMER